ncbi:type II toxin-antitoxin system VapC family toxin [Candidatus Peregrinibacteria bacterium]|nr:type II toxin-antitoxin system VapC family toxin [Candidatus Peregrinibacteria bacterium]
MAENRTKLYVVDASVMVKWIFQWEDQADFALKIRDDYLYKKINLFVPVHSFFESINAVAIKAPDSAVTFMSYLLTLCITECRLTLEVVSRALTIMKNFPNVSFYDAVYHAVAMETDATFITADQKYYEQTKALGNILLLSDYFS